MLGWGRSSVPVRSSLPGCGGCSRCTPGQLVLVLPSPGGESQLWVGDISLPAGLMAMKYSVTVTSPLIFLHIQGGHSIDM